MSDELSRNVASEKVLALCKAAAKVRGGAWIEGAPTHVLAEMLLALERDGWTLARAPVPVERPDGQAQLWRCSLGHPNAYTEATCYLCGDKERRPAPVPVERPDEDVKIRVCPECGKVSPPQYPDAPTYCLEHEDEPRTHRPQHIEVPAARLPEQPDEGLRERIALAITKWNPDKWERWKTSNEGQLALLAADRVIAALPALAARPAVPEEPDEGRRARLVEKTRALAAGEPCPSCGMRHADPLDLLEEPGA